MLLVLEKQEEQQVETSTKRDRLRDAEGLTALLLVLGVALAVTAIFSLVAYVFFRYLVHPVG